MQKESCDFFKGLAANSSIDKTLEEMCKSPFAPPGGKLGMAKDILRQAEDQYNKGASVLELIDEAINKLMELRENYGSETIVRKMSDIIPEIRREVELASEGKVVNGILTNYDCIDKMTSIGLLNTELIIIGARPSLGKTSLAICLAYQVIVRDKKCLFISLESKENSLARDRFLPAVSNINSYLSPSTS